MENKKLPIRREKFAQQLVKSGNATQSVINAGYNVTTRESAAAVATKLKKSESVQTRISELLAEQFPTGDLEAASQLKKLLEAPIAGEVGEDYEGVVLSPSEKLAAIKTYASLKGEFSKTTTTETHQLKKLLRLPSYPNEPAGAPDVDFSVDTLPEEE